MKVVICGSVNFPEKMREVESGLKERDHEVVLPKALGQENLNNYSDAEKLKHREEYIKNTKPIYTRNHFDEIKNGDAILVVNIEKKGIPNYIGGATFAEMIFAFYMNKKIFLLNPIPTHERLDFFRDEIECVNPIIIDGNLDLIK